MEALICGEANLDISDDKARTPLMYSVMEDGRLHILRCLIKAGCDINLNSKIDHMTPLQVLT